MTVRTIASHQPDPSGYEALYAFSDAAAEPEPCSDPGRGLALAVKLSLALWLGVAVVLAVFLVG